MKSFQIDAHHLILYVLLVIVSLSGLGVVHQWRVDVEKAKAKSAADQQLIKQADADRVARAKQFEAQLELIQSMKVTPKTPAPIVIDRIQQLAPELAPQRDATKPDAPTPKLELDLEQQARLVNRLVDCKACETERDKLKADVADDATKLKAMTDDRNTWKQSAQGGSLRTRLKRRAWHFVEDAIAIELLRAIGGHP